MSLRRVQYERLIPRTHGSTAVVIWAAVYDDERQRPPACPERIQGDYQIYDTPWPPPPSPVASPLVHYWDRPGGPDRLTTGSQWGALGPCLVFDEEFRSYRAGGERSEEKPRTSPDVTMVNCNNCRSRLIAFLLDETKVPR